MNRKLALAFLLMLVLSGCGGAARATPTPIPASVARPEQPTPAYPHQAGVFSLATPLATPQFAPTAAPEADTVVDAAGSAQRAAIKLFIQNQTPSAVGVAMGGASIYAAPGGKAVASVPVGGVVTVTGKSEDGKWYSVYTNDFAFGWTPAGQLRVFGGDDLIAVKEALDPAPVATLLAQSAQPVHVLDALMATMQATPASAMPATDPAATQAVAESTASTPATPTAIATAPGAIISTAAPADGGVLATPTPESAVAIGPAAAPGTVTEAATTEVATPAAATPAPAPALSAGDVQTGTVVSDGRLNVRTQPDTAAPIVVKLDPGVQVTIIDRAPAGDWLQVQLADGATGWVAAEFVR